VVVRDFDFFGIGGLPTEADAILVVDSNTVLPIPIAAKALKSVAGKDREFPNMPDAVDLVEFPADNGPNGSWADTPGRRRVGTLEDVFSSAVSE